jgi:para-nitrobenzyl esterase
MNIQRNMIVETSSGKLEGVFERNLCTFKGVPYAAPPVGKLRWLPPQAPNSWKDVRPAKEFGAIASQESVSPLFLPSEIEPQSEDCLFLNIYSPGLDNALRPVMVWIHGGAFSIGSGSTQMYSTGTLASNGDIVLVTINYRLGVLGFLNLNEVTGGGIPSTGNEGLQDQIAALRWVKENIAAFGGDPDNVTVFGESAGAMSIGCLLTIPEARGLFHGAILESPVGEMARPLDASVQIAEEFLRIAGLKPTDISGLRNLSARALLRAQQMTAIKTEQGAAPAVPVADGVVMPGIPLDLLETGRGARVPTLIGSNLEEDKFFAAMTPKIYGVNEETLFKMVSRYVEVNDVHRLIETYRRARTKRGEPVTSFEILSAINTDLLFRKTAIRIAQAQCKHAPGGYNYVFTWKSAAAGGKLGACHVLEIGFVFGNYSAEFNGSGPDADQLCKEMQDAWVSFARAGNPSCGSLGEWLPYGNDRYSMIFGRNSRLGKAAYEEERQIWETVRELKFSNMP